MSDVTIVVDEENIIVSPDSEIPSTTVIVNDDPEVIVVPSFDTQEINVSVQPPAIVIEPTPYAPFLKESYGIQDLYILIVDVDQLEIWQNKLNDVADTVDGLVVICTDLRTDVDDLLSRVTDNEIAITGLQNAFTTLSGRIDLTTNDYDALKILVDANTAKLSVFEVDLDNFNSVVLTLSDSLTAQDGRITANANLINLNEVSITQNGNDIHAHALSLISLGTQVTDLDQQQVSNANALQSLSTDITVVDGKTTVNASAITSIGSNITDMDGRVLANATAYDALHTEVTSLDGHFTALSEQTIELLAEVPSGFNPVIGWEFIDDLEGWIAGETASIAHDVQIARITGNGHIEVAIPDPVSGTNNPMVTLRWKPEIEDGDWVGEIYYKYTGGPSTFTVAGTFSHFTGDPDYHQSTIECNWEGKTITALGVKFFTGGTIALDSIGIGYRTSFGPLAYIKKHSVAWVTEDEAFAQDQSDMHAQINTNEQANISLDQRVSAVEGQTQAEWVLKVEAGNKISGMKITAADGTVTESTFNIYTNDFFITAPGLPDKKIFEVATDGSGNDYIRLAGQVEIEQTIQSSNFVSIVDGAHAGWEINQDGSAEFSSIKIYTSDGELILSSGDGGLQLDDFADTIKDDMAQSLTGLGGSSAASFVGDMQDLLQQGIQDNTVAYIKSVIFGDTWTQNAYISNAFIANLTIGTGQMALGAATDIATSQASPMATSLTTVLIHTQSLGQKTVFTIYVAGSFNPGEEFYDVTGTVTIKIYRYNYASAVYESTPLGTFTLYIPPGPVDNTSETPVASRGFNSITVTHVDSTPPSSVPAYVNNNDSYKVTFDPGEYSRIDQYSITLMGCKR